MSALTDQLAADLGYIITNDIPKSIVIASTTVTGLVEDVRRQEMDELGGYQLELSTNVHIKATDLTNPPTIGLVITVDGVAKRIQSWTKTCDDNSYIIAVDDPG